MTPLTEMPGPLPDHGDHIPRGKLDLGQGDHGHGSDQPAAAQWLRRQLARPRPRGMEQVRVVHTVLIGVEPDVEPSRGVADCGWDVMARGGFSSWTAGPSF